MFVKKIFTNLELIQRIEYILGIHRNFNRQKAVIKIFIILQIMILFTISIYGIKIFNITFEDREEREGNFTMLIYMVFQHIEICIVQACAIYFSSDYKQLLQLFESFDGVVKKKYSTLFCYGILIYIASALGNIVYNMSYIDNYFSIVFIIFSWYYSMGSHLLQDALYASLYITFEDITKSLHLKIITIREEKSDLKKMDNKSDRHIYVTTMNTNKRLSELWISYDKLTQCCSLFNKIFGYQVGAFY